MNKVLVSICIAGAALAMSSCRLAEKAVPLSSINGEWNSIEVNGLKVTSFRLLLLIQRRDVCPAVADVTE